MAKIVVLPYTDQWDEEFQKAKSFYLTQLEFVDIEVVHVGSTSVKGLWAKPILDIDIIVNSITDSLAVIKKLETVGYQHLGDLGISGREVMKSDKNNKFLAVMNHHLYVCVKGNENLNNHLLLKKHLVNNSEAVIEYSKLKIDLAVKYEDDIDAYVEAKSELILKFLELEGLDQDTLNRIELMNKKK